ncbi:hypothetical protein DFH28DRAFT_889607, partial [Melampsora americana]
SPDGRTTYSHDTSHPSWRTKDNYKGMLAWRYPRCITDDRVAVEFNGVCDAARSLNGLSHQTDPLPWCRDGTNPAREAHASAKYNVHVLREVKAPSSSGEDECLRKLMVDSDEDPVTPGPSMEHLISLRRQSHRSASWLNSPAESTPTPAIENSSPSSSHGLVRKCSPVKHRTDIPNLPLTRPRLDAFHGRTLSSTEEVDEPHEVDVGEASTCSAALITPKARQAPIASSMGKGGARGLTRARKSRVNRSGVTSFHATPLPITVGPSPTSQDESPSTTVIPAARRHPFQRLTSITANQHSEGTPSSRSSRIDSASPKPDSIDLTVDTEPHVFRRSSEHTDELEEEDLPSADQVTSPTKRMSLPKATSPAAATGRFRWPEQPGPLDVLWLSFLASTSPFAVANKTSECFRSCTETLTHTYTLRNRFDNLKKWLARVESKSRSDSGTQEDDGELRAAIKALAVQEEVSPLDYVIGCALAFSLIHNYHCVLGNEGHQ